MEIEHIKNRGVTFWSERIGPKCDPLVFDVFYLHKYSHGFSNFNDIIIQFFRKTSVMTVATLLYSKLQVAKPGDLLILYLNLSAGRMT